MTIRGFISKIKPPKKQEITIDPRITELKEEINRTIMQAELDGRFSFYEFQVVQNILSKCEKNNSFDKYSMINEMVSTWDRYCNLSRELGEYINREMLDESKVLAIHRTNIGPINDYKENPILNSIMEEGLMNMGHGMQGVFVERPSLALTTTPLSSLEGLINLIGSYKGNNAVILLSFPADEVDDKLDFKVDSTMIYQKSGNTNYIKPEYILGAIIKKDHELDEYHTREDILYKKETKEAI